MGMRFWTSGAISLIKGKKVVAVALIAVLVIAFCARVAFVNADAQHLEVQTYEIGEKVDLDGSFLEYATENTAGYSIRVTGARIMSSREYAEAYGVVADVDDKLMSISQALGAGDSEGAPALDEKTEVVLDVEVANTDNDDGYLMALSWRLIPEKTRDAAFQPDFDLWGLANPAMGEQIGFTIRSGSSMSLHIPFKRDIVRPPLKSNGYSYIAVVQSESYYFQVSNVPVRRVVDLGVPERT